MGISLRSVTGKIRDALALSDTSRSSFASIREEVQEFADALVIIAGAMSELSGGSREIVQATSQISEVTQRIRGNSQDMSGRSAEIERAMQSSKDISSTVVNGTAEIGYIHR